MGFKSVTITWLMIQKSIKHFSSVSIKFKISSSKNKSKSVYSKVRWKKYGSIVAVSFKVTSDKRQQKFSKVLNARKQSSLGPKDSSKVLTCKKSKS